MVLFNRSLKVFKSFSLSDAILVCIATIAIGCFYPAMWDIFTIGYVGFVFQIVYLSIWFFTLFLLKRGKKVWIDVNTTIVLLSITLFYLIHCVIYQDKYENSFIYLEILVILFLAKNSFKSKKLMEIVLILHCGMVIAMVIGSLLAYMNLIHPIGEEYYIEEDNAKVINYGFFYWKTFTEWDALIIRPSGYYDEPGSLAFVIYLLLAYNKLHLNNKWYEIILLFGGLFTLSLAYYIIFLAYILFFWARPNNKVLFLLLLLVIGSIVFFYSLDTSDPIIGGIQHAVFGRSMELVDGTDGSRDFNASKEAFLYYFPFGSSLYDIDKNFPGATHETIWFYLARFGLIGSIILFFPIFQLIIRNIKKGVLSDEMKLLYILIICLAQRPNLYVPICFMIFYFTWFNKDKVYVNNIGV